MIRRVGDFVPFGAPESPVKRLDPRILADILKTPAVRAGSDDALADVLQRSFGVALFDALSQRRQVQAPAAAAAGELPGAPATAAPSTTATAGAASTAAPASTPAVTATAPARSAARSSAPGAPTTVRALPAQEEATIGAAAARAAIDPKFLQALRRAENGGPGREFGVLSVPAPTYEDQARVAATSVRKNIERFEATGGQAIDPATGRYTQGFIEFFSRRYAPVGAANDPTNLNQYHARNLIRLYASVSKA